MAEFIYFFNEKIAWGTHLIIILLFCGAVCTVKSGFIQRKLFKGFKEMVTNSGFDALCLSLAATLGTGNITGVAISVSVGGAGALFWMIVAGFLGMATKYAEGLLGVKYANITDGGAFYYIEYGLGKRFKPLAKTFAFFGAMAGVFGIGTAVQSGAITEAVNSIVTTTYHGISKSVVNITCGVVFSVITALVIFGGGKRTVAVTTRLVPVMAVLYSVLSLSVIVINYRNIPATLLRIISSAFSTQSAVGGAVGITVKKAISEGICRGVFSNEAGLGTASLAPFNKGTKAVSFGLVQMVSAFIDTVVLCTVAGLCITVSNADKSGKYGIQLMSHAISGLPIPEILCEISLYLCIILFAFSTIIGWNYYGEKCYRYLSNNKNIVFYRVLYCIAVFFGATVSATTVWQIADIFNAFMVLPNTLAVLLLSNDVKRETKRFFNKP